MVNSFPNLKLTRQLGSTTLAKGINVLNFKKLFGHFSCDTNLIKTYRLGYMRCATII